MHLCQDAGLAWEIAVKHCLKAGWGGGRRADERRRGAGGAKAGGGETKDEKIAIGEEGRRTEREGRGGAGRFHDNADSPIIRLSPISTNVAPACYSVMASPGFLGCHTIGRAAIWRRGRGGGGRGGGGGGGRKGGGGGRGGGGGGGGGGARTRGQKREGDPGLRTHPLRPRRPPHDRHAQPPRQAERLYRRWAPRSHSFERADADDESAPSSSPAQAAPSAPAPTSRAARRASTGLERRRRRLRQREAGGGRFVEAIFNCLKPIDRRDQRRRRRRRHHHVPADGYPDRGRAQDRLYLRPARPGAGSRLRLVPAEAGRPAAGVALVPLRPHLRCR